MKEGRNMKARITVLAMLGVALCCPQRQGVESCSFPMYEDSRDVFFYFFDPGLALDARLRPLSFAGLPAATPIWDSPGDAKKDNLEAWREHLKGRFNAEEIEAIVYQAPLDGLRAVAIPGLAKAAPELVSRFAASREDLEYVVYARRCEPLVAPPAGRDPWDSEDWRDYPAMAAMLAEGKMLRQKAATPFIQDRYAFQVVRLAHYSGQYEMAVRLFDEFFPGPPRQGTIYYWSLALKAGALRRLERTAESAYFFSLVFERCRSKRFEAWRGFRIDSDGAYRDCLKLCRDSRERSVVRFLHGLDFDNSALEEMAAIYRELPDSPHLEVLLTREIARCERKLHGAAFNQRAIYWDWPLRDPDEVFRANLDRLEGFLRQAVAAGRVKRADFWNLALGYAHYLSGRLAEARVNLAAVRDGKATAPAVRQQAETFLWLADVAELPAADREGEDRLFAEYRRIRGHFPLYAPGELYSPYSSAASESGNGEGAAEDREGWRDPKFRFLCSALQNLYAKQGDGVREFLATEDWPPGIFPPPLGRSLGKDNRSQRRLIDGLIAFAARGDRSDFENVLLRLKYGAERTTADVSRLLAEQKSMLLMRRCLWSEAAAALKGAVDPKARHSLRTDPFAERPLHPWGGSWSHTGDDERSMGPSAGERLEFSRAMEALTRKANAKADPETTYRLGCALYNVSYVGPYWEMLTTGRSAHDHDPETTAFLLQEASRRFAQAEKAAKDKELAARACFRQADIAVNLYALSDEFAKAQQALPYRRSDGTFIEYDQRQFAVLRAFANPHFPRLRQQYAASLYYKQVVKECKLFAYYASHR